MGEEGIQAVQASDFALASFRYLWKLVLVQGRWNNQRIGKLLNFYLYKNFVFTLPNFFFGFLSLFSAIPVYDGK